MTDNLTPLLDIDRVKFLKKIASKKCVFDALTELLTKGQSEVSKNQVFDALISRDKLGNTSIGNGLSLPRADIDITNPRAALLILKKGINLNSADKIDVNIFLAILIPKKDRAHYSNFINQINYRLATKEAYNLSALDEKIKSKNSAQIVTFFESLFDSVKNKSTIISDQL